MNQVVAEPIEGVLFDAVGTLIEPSPPVAEAYAEAARRQGVDLPIAIVASRFREAFRRTEADDRLGVLETDEANEFRRWRRIVGDVLPELPDLERGFRELWEHFGTPGAWRVFPDVRPTVERLSAAGIVCGIASNFDRRLRCLVQGLPDLRDFRGPVLISSQLGCRKPHPRFYRLACEALGLPPSQVLSVGDDVDNDVQGPRSVGMKSILLDRRRRGGAEAPRIEGLEALGAMLTSDRPSATQVPTAGC